MTSHTPGPWTAFYKHKYDEWHVAVPMSDSTMKWALFDDGIRSENREADACLIAAAPELLAACEALIEASKSAPPVHLMQHIGQAVHKAELAVAKAKP